MPYYKFLNLYNFSYPRCEIINCSEDINFPSKTPSQNFNRPGLAQTNGTTSTYNLQPTTYDLQPTTYDLQPTTYNPFSNSPQNSYALLKCGITIVPPTKVAIPNASVTSSLVNPCL